LGLCKDFGSIVKCFDWGACCKKLLIFCRDFYVFFSGFFDKEVDIQGIKKEILSRQK